VSEHIDVVRSSEEFNADEFLNGITEGWRVAPSGNPISQPYKNPSPPQVPITDTEILYHCPLHESEALQKKKTVTNHRDLWCRLCGILHRLHNTSIARVYLENELDKMRYSCEHPLIMSQSHSEKNPGRLFFKCPKRNCMFFQWVDQEPPGIAKAWMEGSRIQEGYPGPQELFIPQQRDSEMKKVEIRERLPFKKHLYFLPLLKKFYYLSLQ